MWIVRVVKLAAVLLHDLAGFAPRDATWSKSGRETLRLAVPTRATETLKLKHAMRPGT